MNDNADVMKVRVSALAACLDVSLEIRLARRLGQSRSA